MNKYPEPIVTSLENSRSLALIDFTAPSTWFYVAGVLQFYSQSEQEDGAANGLIPAFDLETILRALPHVVDSAMYPTLTVRFGVDREDTYIGYQTYEGFNDWTLKQEAGETLADTAARLFVKLTKEGITNF